METTTRISQLNELKTEYQNLRNMGAVESVQLNTAAAPFLIKNKKVVNQVLDLLIAECQQLIKEELEQ